LYDSNNSGDLCVNEFWALFNAANDGTIPWPVEPEEAHVVEFNASNADGDMALNATELEVWWNAFNA